MAHLYLNIIYMNMKTSMGSSFFAHATQRITLSLHPNLLQLLYVILFSRRNDTDNEQEKKLRVSWTDIDNRPIQEHAAAFGTDLNSSKVKGLSSQQAKVNAAKYGNNIMPCHRSDTLPLWALVAIHLCDVYVVLFLLFGSILVLLSNCSPSHDQSRHTFYMGILLICGGLITCLETCFHETKAGDGLLWIGTGGGHEEGGREVEKGQDTILSAHNKYCWATRDGQRVRLRVADVVPGDVLHLRRGDVVPADCRVLSVGPSQRLAVHPLPFQRARLQAESTCKEEGQGDHPTAEEVGTASAGLSGESEWLLRGSTLSEGSCVAMAIRVGPRTALSHFLQELHAPMVSANHGSDRKTQSLWLAEQLRISARQQLAGGMFQVGALCVVAPLLGRTVGSVAFLVGLIGASPLSVCMIPLLCLTYECGQQVCCWPTFPLACPRCWPQRELLPPPPCPTRPSTTLTAGRWMLLAPAHFCASTRALSRPVKN